MKEFPTVCFSNAPFAIIDGDRGKNYPGKDDLLSIGDCLFLSASNVTNEGFNFSKNEFISTDRDEKLRKGKLKDMM